MNERPTPETNALISVGLENADRECVTANFARKLERERDEARKEAEYYKERYEQLKDERDEALIESRQWRHCHNDAQSYERILRERDEAREQIEVCRGIIERTVIARNSALSDLTELERERDEAREALASREVVIAQQNVITDLILERDGARAVANELSDIASKHLSFLLAITPTKPNEKHEKETEKVIDALKRWKKL